MCATAHICRLMSYFWRTTETSHLDHSLLNSQALGVSLAGSSFLQKGWCRNKNKKSAKISWYFWYEAWKLAIQMFPWTFQSCGPFIQCVRGDLCYRYRSV